MARRHAGCQDDFLDQTASSELPPSNRQLDKKYLGFEGSSAVPRSDVRAVIDGRRALISLIGGLRVLSSTHGTS
jgi:hypothetical protein